jgi:hypothetical protein
MNNYGEAWAYWYLRLNGFFPLGNFVVHKDSVVRHRADVDLLGVRPPHVFEEVGGQQDDWDPALKHATRRSPQRLPCTHRSQRPLEASKSSSSWE